MARKHHYDVTELPVDNAQSLCDALNKRDEDGWELVTAALTPRGALLAMFKQDYKPTAGEPAVAHG